jgi:phage tail sheath protein FI
MPVSPTYPGVYVQEVPSGVRTIVGVGTSIAMFIGRAKSGPLKKPIQCLNFGDFERNFTSQYAKSDLARAVRLFFQNGGTQSYVTRIADNTAAPASVTLVTEAGAPNNSLVVTAKSAGVMGNDIRVRVDYNTLQPEATFNLEVFRWTKSSGGVLLKSDQELYLGLSMDPNSPRYAKDIVSQNSNLVDLTDVSPAAAAQGFSQSGRAVSDRTNTIFRNQWMALLGSGATTNRFLISVDGNSPVDVNLQAIDFTVAPLNTAAGAVANLAGQIQQKINANLSGGAAVAVSFQAGPTGPAAEDNATTGYLRIESANGDVVIQPGVQNDLAVPLMLGTAQGGLEVSKFANKRPAPNGLVFDLNDLVTFAELPQAPSLANGFDRFTIDTVDLDLIVGGPNQLTTSSDPPVTGARMYHDASATSVDDGAGGVREKWSIIASVTNAKRAADPTFGWIAELWGSRLAILPAAGGDNVSTVVHTSRIAGGGTDLMTSFVQNVRYYSLGVAGTGVFQTAGTGGNDGGAPQLTNYADAYTVIDKEVDLFNLLVLPKDADHSEATTNSLWSPASTFCQQRRAFLLMDPPVAWTDSQKAVDPTIGVNALRVGLVKDYSSVFYPRITISEDGKKINVGPSGAIAGLMARIDSTRGVWKAPAGTEADLRGIVGLERQFSDGENGVLNPQAVNTIRVFPNGIVNWGARTMDGDDRFASEYKYIPVRRLALFMEESLYRGLKWVVFEPNDEPLWAQIRLNVGAFMHDLFRQGAFQGKTPREAYFVKCDGETTTQSDRNLGIVNIWVGFAPLKPAEFVILYLQQMAGQIQT